MLAETKSITLSKKDIHMKQNQFWIVRYKHSIDKTTKENYHVVIFHQGPDSSVLKTPSNWGVIGNIRIGHLTFKSLVPAMMAITLSQ